MKTLYIVRHAKSSWDFPELPDAERPLLEKGKKRTRYIIQYLLDNKVNVDLIMSSHAVRAMETARIIAHSLNYNESRIQVSRSIYHGDDESYFDLLYDLSDSISSVMIVGHNPAMTNFANRLLSEPIDWLPTSAVVRVDFNADEWTGLPQAKHKVGFYITPKQIREQNNRKKRNFR